MDMQATLQQLAARPYTDHPFLSLYLDWMPDGNGQRQAPRIVERELNQLGEQLNLHGNARTHFQSDQQRIMTYLAGEAPNDAHGLAIFACNAEGLWEALPLLARFTTKIVEDRYPHLFDLARVQDDYETYAVVLAEGQEARLLLISLDDITTVDTTTAAETIKRFDQGGYAQMRLQRRVDNQIKAHTNEIVERLGEMIARHNVRHVILASNDAIKGTLTASLPDSLKTKLVAHINLDPNANTQEIMNLLVPIMRQVEHDQETTALADLEEQNYPAGLGTAGTADTALALSKGQVHKLIVSRTFTGEGGECPSCATLRVGQREKCPYDGTPLRLVDLREIFTIRALQQNAEIEFIESSSYLDQHEGVGALLRYNDTERAVAGTATG